MFQKKWCDGKIPQVITGDFIMKGACLTVIHKQGLCEAHDYIKDFTGLEILWKTSKQFVCRCTLNVLGIQAALLTS